MSVLEWIVEPFALGFQQRALLGGMIAGLMSSVVGTWLVLRGMSFFGDAFVHGIIPGIAAAVVFDFNPLIGAAIAAAVMVAGVEVVHRRTALKEDTGIGLLFVGMLALGVVIISMSDSYSGSLTNILFGDALGVTWADLIVQTALATATVGFSIVLYRPLLALAFDRNKAETLGMKPGRTHALLLVLIATAVIGSYQSIGTLLVLGLLIGPPATAALVARTVPMMMGLAALIAAVSVVLGLLLSYHLGTAGSATMAVIPILIFFLTLGVTSLTPRSSRHAKVHAVVSSHPGSTIQTKAAVAGRFAVRCRNLVLSYGGHVIVAKSSFDVPSGALTAIIGPNGSGKTSLLHAMAGLMPATSGSVEVLGGSPTGARSKVSYVLQTVTLPVGAPITVGEAVGMGRYATIGWWRRFTRADRARVNWAMDALGIGAVRRRHLGELSGGQRQRVYIAQGLAQDHELLLLDEPLTGLDLVSAQTIDHIIHTEREHGRTTVLTTHDLDEARAADHVLLVSGRVVASGPPSEVLTRRNLEIAYGLGALHGADEKFLDDPHRAAGHDDSGAT